MMSPFQVFFCRKSNRLCNRITFDDDLDADSISLELESSENGYASDIDEARKKGHHATISTGAEDGSETADILKHLEEEMEEWITINEISHKKAGEMSEKANERIIKGHLKSNPPSVYEPGDKIIITLFVGRKEKRSKASQVRRQCKVKL